ncbi:MAG: translation initiation factor eIF-2B [Candidatus Komeilibacteria bacterium]
MSLQKTVNDIRDLRIQGATAVARVGIQALVEVGQSARRGGLDFMHKIKSAIDDLADARPTEPLLHNGLNYILFSLQQNDISDLSIAKATLDQAGGTYLQLMATGEQKLIDAGQSLVKKNYKVLTHCHSSAVEKILVQAYQKKSFSVFNSETRPLLQGHITATNLLTNGLPVTMVADSALAWVASRASGKDLAMNMVIVGADSISWAGDIYNKIGSYSLALAAHTAKIPFYVAAIGLKMDADDKIEIELRDDEEIWPDRPEGLKILNLAFDRVPAKYITGIITEFGIVKPGQLKNKVAKTYPWLLQKN